MTEESAKKILTLLTKQSREMSDLRNMLGAIAAQQVKLSKQFSK
mgnify:CR=1 FL=1|tara:strand:+ start:890 stop:1021 length:132 start_codon:yes stop_codon:yes gene_type:complete